MTLRICDKIPLVAIVVVTACGPHTKSSGDAVVQVQNCDTVPRAGPHPGAVASIKPAAELGALVGTIAVRGSGAAISGAGVQLQRDSTFYLTSDSTGGFAFNDLPPGQYDVHVVRIGYIGARDSVRIAAGHVDTVHYSLRSYDCP
jgi:hypothetical protein